MPNRAQQLHDRARRCRELAERAMTDEGRTVLFEIAERYEQQACSETSPHKTAFAEAVA